MGKIFYVGVPMLGYPASATGQSILPWMIPPAGRWRLLCAKMTLHTDATPGQRYITYQVIGPLANEIAQVASHPAAPGIGPNSVAYIFHARGAQQDWSGAPTYYNPLPDVPAEQDEAGNWAFAFHNSGVVGPGDLWAGARFQVELVE